MIAWVRAGTAATVDAATAACLVTSFAATTKTSTVGSFLHNFIYQPVDPAPLIGITRDGGFGDYVTLRASTLCRVPDDVDPAELAPLLCAGGTTFSTWYAQRGEVILTKSLADALCNMNIHAGELVAVQGIG